MMEKSPRPRVLGGITVKVVTPCGNMYVQMNWKGNKLSEVFATLGHSGGCASSQSEAVTRCVTLGLRCGVPLEEYVKQLRGIRCPNPVMFPKKSAILSCPDALGKVLAEFGGLGVNGVIKLFEKGSESSTELIEDDVEDARNQAEVLAKERERLDL